MDIIGHRGSAFTAPENTLISVLQGWESGADAVEVDVHLSADNRIVVIHDEMTRRTTGKNLEIRKTVSAELRRLDAGSFKGDEFKGEKIPFLEEIIETIPHGKKLLIEIKCGNEILSYLNETIASSGKKSQIVLVGFGLETMSNAKIIMPDIPVHWIRGPVEDKETKEWLPYETTLISMAGEHSLDALNVHYLSLTETFVERVKAAGLKLYVWTVNDPEEALRLVKLGVDGITTDNPRFILQVLNKRKK